MMSCFRRWFLTALACCGLMPCSFAQEVKAIQATTADSAAPEISVWYGARQVVGKIGHAQPQIHVLGSITPAGAVADMSYRLNRSPRRPLILGPDLHRLARPGDFNIGIDRDQFKPGDNTLQIRARTLRGKELAQDVILEYRPDAAWPLPYEVDFSKLEAIHDAVEVVDGKWELTDAGVRTSVPYYDRTLALGDASWKDYEVEADIIFHRHFVDFQGRNKNGPPYLSHAHTSFNLRWTGYPDDGWVPRRDWQSIGSLVALRCDLAQANAGSYWWMHFGRGVPGVPAKRSLSAREQRHDIQLETRYRYRMQVETISETQSRYRTKVWRADEDEPAEWQMEAVDESESITRGCAVFVVHHSDVTLCRVRVTPLGTPTPDG